MGSSWSAEGTAPEASNNGLLETSGKAFLPVIGERTGGNEYFAVLAAGGGGGAEAMLLKAADAEDEAPAEELMASGDGTAPFSMAKDKAMACRGRGSSGGGGTSVVIRLVRHFRWVVMIRTQS